MITGQVLDVSQAQLQSLQNYTQNSKGFTAERFLSAAPRFQACRATYSYDVSSLVAVTTASKNLFNYLAFSGVSGPNALNGIVTSKVLVSYSENKLDAASVPPLRERTTSWGARFRV